MATMRPRLLVKPTTAMAVPPGATTSPARPLTSGGRARRANGRPRDSWSRAKLRLAQGSTRHGVDDLVEVERLADQAQITNSVMYPRAALAAPRLFQLGAREDARRIADRVLRSAPAGRRPLLAGAV